MRLAAFALLLLSASLATFAADAAGTWKLSYTTENGLRREALLDLKVDGDSVTGTVSSSRGSAQIEDGKISGEEISFQLARKGNGDEIAVRYKGRIEDGTMKLKMQFGRREAVAVTGKRGS